MIGKVLRGRNTRRLLTYLYGPGQANEHTDPHLVAGFGDPAELEPEHCPGGTRDLRRLSGLLEQPLAALAGPGYDKPVWHCAIRTAPEDRMLSDTEWALVAKRVMHRSGLAPADDELGVRWVAVRHAADHIHIVATLARQDGRRPRIWATTTGSGKRAGGRNAGSGYVPLPRRIAPRHGAPPGRRRNRRPGVAGRNQPE